MLPDAIFLNIHMYGVMIAVGIVFAFIVLFSYSKKKNIDEKLVNFIFYDGIGSILFGFLSAAFFQGLYDYIENPDAGFHIDNGITFMGGLFGGVLFFLTVYFIARKN